MLFPVLDARVTIPGAPVIDAAPAFAYVPAPEPGAQHWLFGGSDSSLLRFGGSTGTLTPQAGTHVYGSNYVEVQAYAQALVSNFMDQTTQTHIAVVRYQPVASKNVLILGNIDANVNGWGMWIDSSGLVSTILRNNTPALVNHGAPVGVAVGDYMFIAQSLWLEGGVTHFRTCVAGQVYEGAWTGVRPVATRAAALGNATQPSATYTPTPTRFAEYIAFPGVTKTAIELADIHERTRRRMLARGLVIV
jgi:hypothetical protein